MTRRPAAPTGPGRPDSSAPVGVQMFGWWDHEFPDDYVVVARWPERHLSAFHVVTRKMIDFWQTRVSLDALWAQVRMRLIDDLGSLGR